MQSEPVWRFCYSQEVCFIHAEPDKGFQNITSRPYLLQFSISGNIYPPPPPIFSTLLLRYIDRQLKFFVISTETFGKRHADFHI